MYQILIIGKIKNYSDDKGNIRHIMLQDTLEELSKREYDLIYLAETNITNKIEKCIFCDYTPLPETLKKLTINEDRKNTYINLQIINKLLIKNLNIIKFEKFDEEPIIAFILKEMLLYNQKSIKKIYKSVSVKLNVKMRTKRIIKKVISRNYSSGKILRKFKYFILQKKVNRQFFEKIMSNIKNDIAMMESL